MGFKASVPTIQRHVSELRKEGLLPAVETSQKPEAVRQRRHRESVTRHQNDAMSQQEQDEVIEISAAVVPEEEQSLADQLKALYKTYEHFVMANHQQIKADPKALAIASWFASINQSYLKVTA